MPNFRGLMIHRSHELVFSLNSAWIVVFYAMGKERLFHWLFFLHFERWLYFHIRTVEPEAVIVLILWSAILALASFLTLQLIPDLIKQFLLRIVAGLTALAGFPLFALWHPKDLFQRAATSGDFALSTVWLVCEIVIVVFCASLYYFGWRWVPASVIVVLATLHSAFWVHITGFSVNPIALARDYGSLRLGFWFSLLFYWGFPLLGFLAVLSWTAYIRTGEIGESRMCPIGS